MFLHMKSIISSRIIDSDMYIFQTATQSNDSNNMDCTGSLEEFIATGRTGRRNAMPDILDSQKAAVSTGGLPFDMEKLNCSGIDGKG